MSENFKSEIEKKKHIIDAALGNIPADFVIKNASYINVFSSEISKGDIAIAAGVIAGIGEYEGEREIDAEGKIVIPGFIDSHLHLESSLACPAELAKAAIAHGTTGVICDPHEIANVMGADGIRYILEATEGLPLDVYVMLPSCVPATPLDESGAVLKNSDIEEFYSHPRVKGLAEMMNFPGVTGKDPEVLEKIAKAQSFEKRTDGHAPGVSGKGLNAYLAAGVSSDHECTNLSEALEKLRKGQFIMIREGTAAKNLESLLPLLNPKYGERCTLCCDDRHPNDILHSGHIDNIVRKAVAKGADPVSVIKASSLNAARYIGIPDRGAVAPGYTADLIVADSLENLEIEAVFKNGKVVFENGKVLDFAVPEVSPELERKARSSFNLDKITPDDLVLSDEKTVIGMIPGQIVTEKRGTAKETDPEKDILKIAVVERHKNTGHIGVGYINGYGLKSGAVATSVSHDSHNIIAVGTNDEDIAFAVNKVIEEKGGIIVAENGKITGKVLLPIAGLMSKKSLEDIDSELEEAKKAAFAQGASSEVDPFMTLSFMALPVIPEIRIMPGGIFDVGQWKYI